MLYSKDTYISAPLAIINPLITKSIHYEGNGFIINILVLYTYIHICIKVFRCSVSIFTALPGGKNPLFSWFFVLCSEVLFSLLR